MTRYPIEEGVVFKFCCPGCESRHSTVVPRHDVPFLWRCQKEGCGWTLTVQTDPAGVSAGFTAPIPKKPELRIVK